MRYVLGVLFCSFTWAANAAPAPLILAVHPYLPVAEINTRFSPLAHYLEQETARPVVIRVGRNYAEHIHSIGSDKVDIAYMGPVPYVKVVHQYGKKPILARQEIGGQPYLRGVIFVRQDSPVQTLAALKGMRFAFGDPDSTMSHVVPLRMLETAGVPEASLGHSDFLGAHKNVALAVLAGDYDAGAVKQEVFDEMSSKGLRSLAISPPVPDHVFITSAKLSPNLQNILRNALLKLKDSAEGKKIMAAIHPGMSALVPANDADYDTLRALMETKSRR